MGKKIIILASILLLMSCSKEDDNCDCEVLSFDKTVRYEPLDLPSYVMMDTVSFAGIPATTSEPYSQDCNDQNKILDSYYVEGGIGNDRYIFFYKEIVKCR